MTIVLRPRPIECPVCNYRGTSRIRLAGAGLGIAGMVCLSIGAVVSPVIVIVGVVLLIAMLFSTRHACKHCGFEHVNLAQPAGQA